MPPRVGAIPARKRRQNLRMVAVLDHPAKAEVRGMSSPDAFAISSSSWAWWRPSATSTISVLS